MTVAPVRAGEWSFRLKDGTTLAYAFEVTADSEMDMAAVRPLKEKGSNASAPPHMVPLKMKASGALFVRFHEKGPDRWATTAMAEDIHISLSGREPDYAWALTAPFSFEMAENGLIEDFRFPVGVPDNAMTFLRQLVYYMQTVLPEHSQKTWTSIEDDVNGRVRTAYTVEFRDKTRAVLQRQIRAYLHAAAGERDAVALLPRLAINVLSSAGRVSVSFKGGWVDDLSAEEGLEFEAQGKVWSRTHSRIAINKTSKTPGPDFPETLAALDHILLSNAYRVTSLKQTDPELDRLGAGLTVAGALEKHHRLRVKDRGLADRFLINYLRSHPEASAALIRMIDQDRDQKQYDEKTRLMLWRLITEAGTPEAQHAMIDAALSPSCGKWTHVHSILYTMHLENPQEFVLDGLWMLHRNPCINNDPEVAGMVENMSLLAIGALGNNEKCNDELKAVVAMALAKHLDKSTDFHEKALTLSAIGNTGNPNLIEEVAPYLSDDNETLRAKAYGALRKMDDPRSQELLMKSFEKEVSDDVRAAAVHALIDMPPSRESVKWAGNMAGSETNARVQALAVQYLGKTMAQYQENKGVLRGLLNTDPPREVKETLYQYIAPVSGETR